VTAVVSRIRALPSWQVTLFVALLALGFLIAAQLSAEGPRVRYTTQQRSPLVETALDLQAQQDALKAQILDLRDRIQGLQKQGEGSAALVRQVNDQLHEARLAAGLLPLTGTGIVIRLEDSTQPTAPDANEADYVVSAADVRTVVEELWLAGAEAISINDERLSGSTAIIDIGGSILVNSAYQAQPYTVTALGPADLWSRLSAQPGFADFFRARAEAYGIRVSLAEPETVDVPAFAGTIALRNARVLVPSPSPTP
jgi:uncharacterized protein YlxW (UPF0749 family)